MKRPCFVGFHWFFNTSSETRGSVTTWSWPLLVSGFQVTVTLYGLDGESEPHHLSDPDIPGFE